MEKNSTYKRRKLSIKKTLVLKQEPSEDDLLDLIELLEPKDIKKLYNLIIGILSTRGYEFINR